MYGLGIVILVLGVVYWFVREDAKDNAAASEELKETANRISEEALNIALEYSKPIQVKTEESKEPIVVAEVKPKKRAARKSKEV